MKRIYFLAILFASLVMMIPKQSKAGIQMMIWGKNEQQKRIGLVSTSLGGLHTFFTLKTGNPPLGPVMFFVGGAMVVLDEATDSTYEGFMQKQFPFIKDQLIISELAEELEYSMGQLKDYQEEIFLDSKRVEEILTDSGLSNKNIKEIFEKLTK